MCFFPLQFLLFLFHDCFFARGNVAVGHPFLGNASDSLGASVHHRNRQAVAPDDFQERRSNTVCYVGGHRS